MATKWTDAQLDAINTRDKELIISAAAGSGKTATLTERIIRSLTDKEDPADISRMLIVTYTKKAAAELRQRIFSAITNALAEDPRNRHLSSQLIKIGSAKICTIDSFYFDLVKENFSSLGLPPRIRIADTAQMKLLQKEVMNDTINRFYDLYTDEFSHFTEAFSTLRSTDRLSEIFLDIRSHLISYPEGCEYINQTAESYNTYAELDFLTTPQGEVILEETLGKLSFFAAFLEDAKELILTDEKAVKYYLPSFECDLAFVKELSSALLAKNYRESREMLINYSPISLGVYRGCPEEFEPIKKKRGEITKEIAELRESVFALSEESLKKALRETAEHLKMLHKLLSDFDEKLMSEKLSRSSFDFDDIRRFAMKLLVDEWCSPTDTAKKLSEHYTQVYIDEYQDVDRVQDLIFSSLSNGRNRFMVGDIKQSIYVFRGAEPSVFAEYKKKFPDSKTDEAKGSDCKSIFMSNNFRCDENIILFTNKICSFLFGICAENIGYTKDDDLVFSKPISSEDYISPRVTLALITPPEEDSDYESNAENNRYTEARYVANEISRLLSDEKKADGSRIIPEDIALIYRSATVKNALMKALDEAGIEYAAEDNDKYFENPDVLLMLSLLNVIDNPERDIYLAATLRSPLYRFTLEDLVLLRRSTSESISLYGTLCDYAVNGEEPLRGKCAEFLTSLSSFRDLSHSLPVDKLIKNIFSSREFCVSGLSSTENLERLYEYARSYESSSFKGLYNFIEYINKLISDGTTFDVPSNAVSTGKVKLMTAHSSKGLEFPVCFLCDTAKKFNLSDLSESLIFEHSTGVAMRLPDSTGFGIMDTPMRHAVGVRILEKQLEEEMRILYVALTRARERLYVTANLKVSAEKLMNEATLRKRYASKHTVLQIRSFLEWILTAIAGEDVSKICDLRIIDASEIPSPRAKRLSLAVSAEEIDADFSKHLLDKLSFDYEYKVFSRVPAKLSVSRLSPDILDENDTSLNLFSEKRAVAVPKIFSAESKEKPTASERGTATHLFLQFCDFSLLEKYGAEKELKRLMEKRFIPDNSADRVFLDELDAFRESELFGKIKRARKVIREQRFNILLPSSDFTKDTKLRENIKDELLAVQGVIDLVLIEEDGTLSLYDYKTDRLTEEELTNEAALSKKMSLLHAQQLSYYKTAVERIFDLPCNKAQVYSTQCAKTVDIGL